MEVPEQRNTVLGFTPRPRPYLVKTGRMSWMNRFPKRQPCSSLAAATARNEAAMAKPENVFNSQDADTRLKGLGIAGADSGKRIADLAARHGRAVGARRSVPQKWLIRFLGPFTVHGRILSD